MKILVITTGGTIGSLFDGSAIDVDSKQSAAVVEMYKQRDPSVVFDTISPVNILSESVTADELNTLAEASLTTELTPYDGVIFTCGSDNLGYIAPFIALLIGGQGKPTAIVATDMVLSEPMANGFPNFCCAVEIIREGIEGVYVPYRNMDGTMYIHSAFDIRQSDLSQEFYSFNGAFAEERGGRIVPLREYVRQTVPPIFGRDNVPRVSDSVALIHPYPMLDYSSLDLSGKKAALHTLYHSATLDSDRFVPFLRTLGDMPVFLSSFRTGRNRYKTAVDAVDAGAIPLYDISPECAYAKLLLACAQDRMSIREFMEA